MSPEEVHASISEDAMERQAGDCAELGGDEEEEWQQENVVSDL